MAQPLPLNVFPGYTQIGVVAPQVREIAVTFNAEALDSLSAIPESDIAWADVGSGVTPGFFEVKIPIRLASSLAFQTREAGNERAYNSIDIAAPIVKTSPFDCNFQWPVQIGQSGIAELANFYGAAGIAADVVVAGRAHKAQLAASLTMAAFTNAALGVTAQALTIPQPGYPNGLPLFSDGGSSYTYGTASGSAAHFAHPFVASSQRFTNLYAGVGTFNTYFGQSLVDMTQVPHPSMPNVTLGQKVTDVVGPTWMLIPFWQTAIQSLSLQTANMGGGSNVGAGTTNIYNAELMQKMGAASFVGASGMAPWRFWIAPQLDSHPYCLANPGKHMWLSISAGQRSPRWCEFAAPNKAFTPIPKLLGDASEEAIKSGMVRLINDLNAGVAAGLPHAVKMYFETVPA